MHPNFKKINELVSKKEYESAFYELKNLLFTQDYLNNDELFYWRMCLEKVVMESEYGLLPEENLLYSKIRLLTGFSFSQKNETKNLELKNIGEATINLGFFAIIPDDKLDVSIIRSTQQFYTEQLKLQLLQRAKKEYETQLEKMTAHYERLINNDYLNRYRYLAMTRVAIKDLEKYIDQKEKQVRLRSSKLEQIPKKLKRDFDIPYQKELDICKQKLEQFDLVGVTQILDVATSNYWGDDDFMNRIILHLSSMNDLKNNLKRLMSKSNFLLLQIKNCYQLLTDIGKFEAGEYREDNSFFKKFRNFFSK